MEHLTLTWPEFMQPSQQAGANEQSLGECLKLSMSSSIALSQGLLSGMINVKNTESKTSPCGLKTSQTSGKVFAYITVAFGL